jgi:translation elongation factor EF-1alpha
MKQTAVEWLIEQFQEQNTPRKWKEIIEQAKAMEKEQILIAYSQGVADMIKDLNKVDANKYYNKTFKQD